ncbi:MAG: hypothetical protein A6F71_02615 [Cycloclasticus sp. symbiont of Poecilosclerida sp. M]|nr:MAG: hypothetical protein A6F71_02615 [Cycloclasticus sp. symbiont of Poecilosclerida sp. M]
MLPDTKNPLIFNVLIIVTLVTIAFSLRLYYINHTVIDAPIRADAKDYYSYAVNIKNHHVYSRAWPSKAIPKPDTLRAPGYPFFISKLVSWPPTKSMLWKISFWQALLDTLTVLMTFLLARHFLNTKLAVLAALFVAISPHLISATSYLLTETLFGCLMTASVLTIVSAVKRNSQPIFLLAGILLALASLTRPTIQYFIVPLAVGLFIAQNQLLLKKGVWLSLILGFFLTYTPWTVRNIETLGVTSDPTLTINTLHHGIYPDFMYKSIPQTKGAPYHHDPRSKEISTSVRSVLDEIISRFKNEPLRHLKWYLIDKPITFFSWGIVAGFGDVFIYPVIKSPYFNNPTYKNIHQVMHWLHWPLVILSLFACCVVWLPNRILKLSVHGLISIRILSLLTLYFLAVHIVGAPFPRYSFPLRPVTFILASWSIGFLIKSTSRIGANHEEKP